MSAVATITLPDAQGTPVNHDFIPLSPDQNGVWWFEDQTGTSAIGYNKISLQLVRPLNPAPGQSSGKRVSRVKMQLHEPTLVTLGTNDAGITPPAQIDYIVRAAVEMILPEQSNLQNRKDIRKYLVGLLGNTQVVNMIENLQNIY
jgi:hypothetical protein